MNEADEERCGHGCRCGHRAELPRHPPAPPRPRPPPAPAATASPPWAWPTASTCGGSRASTRGCSVGGSWSLRGTAWIWGPPTCSACCRWVLGLGPVVCLPNSVPVEERAARWRPHAPHLSPPPTAHHPTPSPPPQFAAKRLRLEGVQGSSTACLVLVDQLQGRLRCGAVRQLLARLPGCGGCGLHGSAAGNVSAACPPARLTLVPSRPAYPAPSPRPQRRQRGRQRLPGDWAPPGGARRARQGRRLWAGQPDGQVPQPAAGALVWAPLPNGCGAGGAAAGGAALLLRRCCGCRASVPALQHTRACRAGPLPVAPPHPTLAPSRRCCAGHYEGADLPEDAMLTTMPLAPGDIVVLGSDGL